MKAGWQTKTLGEVLLRTETINPLNSPDAEFSYIDVSSVSNATFQIEKTQTLRGKDAPSRARRLVKSNDVLFATVRPTLQRIAIVPSHLDNQVCSTGYCVLRPKAEIDHRFLFYLLFTEGFINRMKSIQKGASYPAVTDGEVREHVISCPPLAEQRRIVGILDEAFEGIATAKANAEKNPQNARAVFGSHLNAVFTQRGEGWVEKRLGELADFRNGINYTKDSKGERVKIVGVKDFQKSYWVPWQHLDSVRINGTLCDIDLLRRGDILAVRSNGNLELIGRCILAGEVPETISHSGFTIRIRLSTDEVLPEYLCHFMKSTNSRKRLIDGGTGTNIKSLNQQTLSALRVPFPIATEQETLVARLKSISEETQRLESICQQKLAKLEELKKSLLHQACTGEL